MPSKLIEKHFRRNALPHIWCPGCSHGIITRCIAQAVEQMSLSCDDVIVVSGIGCSSRASGYLNYNTIHTTHGRAIPVATGIRLALPDSTVIVISGDGDATAIGGNHLIHAARRNIDLTVVVYNNFNYGMTGGQHSPTTPPNKFGTTAPYGNIDGTFDIPLLAQAAGATYTARGTAFDAAQLVNLIKGGISNRGFSIIDAVGVCPTQYGRKNNLGNLADMYSRLRDNSIDVIAAKKMYPAELSGKYITGVLYHSPREEYCDRYRQIIETAGGLTNG